MCGKLEAELAELDPKRDRKEMLESMGLAEPGAATLAREAYKLLGLQSYFTAGPPRKSAPGRSPSAPPPRRPPASSTPTSRRAFIRADSTHIDDLKQYKTETAIKAAGKCGPKARNTS